MKTILVLLALAHVAGAQTPPDWQRVLDRLDRLEEENHRLLEEIRALRSELTPGRSETPAAPAEERLAVQESRTEELAQTKVEASQKLPVSLTGMLLFNAFANSRRGAFEYPTAAALNPGSATTGATLRQTVLGLKFNGPDLPGGGKANGTLYMDFFSGALAPDQNQMHLRIATLDLSWKHTTFTVGQDKPIVAPREPTSLAQVGLSPLTNAGNLWDWNPQVKIEHRVFFGENTGLRLQGGVYQTSERTTAERARPGYEGRFEFFHGGGNRRIELAPGFHLSTTHVNGKSVDSRIATFDWMAKPSRALEFTGQVFRGQNVSVLGARGGFSLTGGVPAPIHSSGEWGQIAIFPLPRLSLHLYAGAQQDRAADLVNGGATRNFLYAGNFVYKLAPNVLASFEASQVRTEYIGSQLRLNNHYDLALAYLF